MENTVLGQPVDRVQPGRTERRSIFAESALLTLFALLVSLLNIEIQTNMEIKKAAIYIPTPKSAA